VDFQNQQAGTPPPIFKKQAKTVLKVRDGQTVVIGGIFVTSEGISQQGLPFSQRFPFWDGSLKIELRTEITLNF